jgi:hypothetical protein
MVNIPFVSEDFQRAFRNQFPAQTSTGRDLHVSDVVVPIVDFTPTSSGASLPQNLRFANSSGTSYFLTDSDITRQDLITNSGFHLIEGNFTAQVSGTEHANMDMQLEDKATSSLISLLYLAELYSGGGVSTFSFIAFLTPENKITIDTNLAVSSTRLRCFVKHQQIADVNGNLTNPIGYLPE